jgi:hypothetical protein
MTVFEGSPLSQIYWPLYTKIYAYIYINVYIYIDTYKYLYTYKYKYVCIIYIYISIPINILEYTLYIYKHMHNIFEGSPLSQIYWPLNTKIYAYIHKCDYIHI